MVQGRNLLVAQPFNTPVCVRRMSWHCNLFQNTANIFYAVFDSKLFSRIWRWPNLERRLWLSCLVGVSAMEKLEIRIDQRLIQVMAWVVRIISHSDHLCMKFFSI